MQGEVDQKEVISYYNNHVQHKLNDYIKVNPRIESAWKTLTQYAPGKPVKILEVGCGIGSICSRLHSRWPEASITGMDISTTSIQIANKLFANNKVNFVQGILTPETFQDTFDLIIFMDVYEHISVEDRPAVHAALSKLLNNQGRIFLSVPTPHNLRWSLKHKPETMQPVDEHISFELIGELANATQTEVVFYEKKDIWNVGDYAHIVLEKNDDFEAAFFHPKPVTSVERASRILRKAQNRAGSFMRRLYVKSKMR